MMLEHKSGGQASHRHTQYKTNGQHTGQTPLHKRWYVLSHLSLPCVADVWGREANGGHSALTS